MTLFHVSLLTVLTWACHFLSSKHLHKLLHSTVLQLPLSLFCWNILVITNARASSSIPPSPTEPYGSLDNSDTASSQGLTAVCRSKPILRPRLDDWGWSIVPLRKNPAVLLQIYSFPHSSWKVTIRHLCVEEERLRKFLFSDTKFDLILETPQLNMSYA